MSDTATVNELPRCDIHEAQGEIVPAHYDARIPRIGSWGYLCEECFTNFGPGQLGTGHGQRLVVKP